MEGGLDLAPNLIDGQGAGPWVGVRHPDGSTWAVDLVAGVLRVGREAGWTDVDLGPDDRNWISRRHCRIERRGTEWVVVDEGSRNGTFVSRAGVMTRVDGAAPLAAGDTIALLAHMDGLSAAYWELLLHDPDLTAPAPRDPPPPAVDYDWVGGRVSVVDGPGRRDIDGLRPQEHRLVRHFVARNEAAGGAALCPYAELIVAVWGEEAQEPHTRDDLARLVYDLRRKLEVDPARPRLLQTVRGFGYRLVTVGTG